MEPLTTVNQARREALRLLAGVGTRLEHVAGVAAAAELVSSTVPAEDVEVLVAAAWLHDIGYAPALAATGFHPLDGARYLRSIGADERPCRLVANHTPSRVEAETRGLAGLLVEEFPPEWSPTADALTYADLTTGPSGARVSVEERLGDIVKRYEPGHVVHESIRRAEPELLMTVRRVTQRLRAARAD